MREATIGSAADDWPYWSTWSATHKLPDESSVAALAEVYFRNKTSDKYAYDEYVTYSG